MRPPGSATYANQPHLSLFEKCFEKYHFLKKTTVGDQINIMKKTKNERTQNMVKKMYR